MNVVFTSSDPLPVHNTITVVQPSIDSVLSKVDLFADPSFKPIIPVLEETPVLLENEEEIFSLRGKMLYFDTAWKDVGMGNIKIIKNGKDEKARIVMRHDQTLKICVNYQVKLNDNLDWNTTDKTITWSTPGYVQDGIKVEKLQVKVRNVEIAKKFVSKFEEALKLVGKGKVKEPEKPKITFGTPSKVDAAQPQNSSGFSFGNTATVTAASEKTLVTTAAADSTKPATGFTFGSGSFSFGAATESTPTITPSFLFNTPTKVEPEKNKEEEVKNPFDNAAKKDSTFNFVFKPKSPSAKSPGRSANNSISEDQSDNKYHAEELQQTEIKALLSHAENKNLVVLEFRLSQSIGVFIKTIVTISSKSPQIPAKEWSKSKVLVSLENRR